MKIYQIFKSYLIRFNQKIKTKLFGSKLGGNLGKTNIDEKSLEFLIKRFKIKSFLDIGCGKGGMVFYAINKGLFARGVEGDAHSIPVDCPLINKIDYRNSYLNFQEPFDLAWSVEVLEHIPEGYLKNVFKDFRNCKFVIFTAAPPGWGGEGHVNERDEKYWIKKFSNEGFKFDQNTTNQIREISEIKFGGIIRHEKKQFIQNRGLFFVNEKFQNDTKNIF